jgi:hypothetical protein
MRVAFNAPFHTHNTLSMKVDNVFVETLSTAMVDICTVSTKYILQIP